MKSLAHAKVKRVRAVEMLVAGRTYDEIASELGFSHRGSAHRAVTKALAEQQTEAVEELRRIELDRLDKLQSSVWCLAMDGNLKAITTVLRVIEQRARLLGLGTQNTVQNAACALVRAAER